MRRFCRRWQFNDEWKKCLWEWRLVGSNFSKNHLSAVCPACLPVDSTLWAGWGCVDINACIMLFVLPFHFLWAALYPFWGTMYGIWFSFFFLEREPRSSIVVFVDRLDARKMKLYRYEQYHMDLDWENAFYGVCFLYDMSDGNDTLVGYWS